jgi:hypothetical protein
MYGKPVHDLFKLKGVPVWFRNHHTFETNTLSGYRSQHFVKCYADQSATSLPPPPPILYGINIFTI